LRSPGIKPVLLYRKGTGTHYRFFSFQEVRLGVLAKVRHLAVWNLNAKRPESISLYTDRGQTIVKEKIDRMFRLSLLLVICLANAEAEAQKTPDVEKRLHAFWKSKHVSANAISQIADLRPGDVIADIGTGDGWFAAVLSTFTDHLTMYLEDVDSVVWKQESFDRALSYFSQQADKPPLKSTFYHRIGSQSATGLAHQQFNKVLIIDTYHHLNNRREMISDAVKLLKPEGKIIILEALARKSGDVHQGCKTPIYFEDEIVSQLQELNMKLLSATLVHTIAGRKNKLLIFVRE
jgi:ubiquinone/menaquinone biosynthesis C-methylase UbiE